MSWDAIGAVGTLVGGFAVLLTLVYLSIQVRQNSRAVQLSVTGPTSRPSSTSPRAIYG